MSIEHPLALELESLKNALEKYQAGHAAHTSSLQLQRAHLETTEALARSKSLDADNARLKHEIAFLRANPDTTPASLQASELSLALRRSSDKLDLTEGLLLQRTTELAHALSEKARMQLEAKAMLAELDRVRQRGEEARSRERDLKNKCKAAQEEARMADVVVMEYADLVRSLEGSRLKTGVNGETERYSQESKDSFVPSTPPATNGDAESYSQARSDSIIQSLAENRFSLQRLLHEFNSETSSLQAEITRLHVELSSAQAALDTERENSRLDRVRLAEAIIEADRHKTDDAAAGKIVSRYMRFSQSSIDMLQAALTTLRSRHAATMTTMSSLSEALSHSLALERKRAYQLRDALDQLAEDISRETFGRRREIGLRLRSVVREEKTAKALSAWLRRAEERWSRASEALSDKDDLQSSEALDATSEQLGAALGHMIQDAQALLTSLALEDDPADNVKGNGSLARVIFVEEMARSLTADLQKETEKRMALTRTMAKELLTSPRSSKEFIISPPSKELSTSSLPAAADVQQDVANPHTPLSKSNDVSSPPDETLIRFPTLELGPVSAKTASLPSHPDHDVANKEPEAVAQYPQYHNHDETPEPDAIAPSLPSEKLELGKGTMADQLPDMEEAQVVLESSSRISPKHESVSKPHPLLDDLTRVLHRYDALSRAFRDCHLTLAKLKADIAPISIQAGIPIVHNVIHRLDDFCEDTRVELEIRIADEERIAKGFETLLGVPGALAGYEEKGRVEHELKIFLDGTTPSVAKAYESCTTKLNDLQHDIAQVKRALHESLEAASEVQTQDVSKIPPVWSSWTPPFLSSSPSRPSSPTPSFGAVITTPRPRRVSSTSLFSLSPSRIPSESPQTVADPYAQLGLRISMPSQAPPATSPLSSRIRKTSSSTGMYLLGMGSRSGFFSKQEAIAEAEAPKSKRSRESEDDSDTQKSQSDVE